MTALIMSMALMACSQTPKTVNKTVEPVTNPLLAEWVGPYGGVPAFDKMDLADVPAAFDEAIAENLAD